MVHHTLLVYFDTSPPGPQVCKNHRTLFMLLLWTRPAQWKPGCPPWNNMALFFQVPEERSATVKDKGREGREEDGRGEGRKEGREGGRGEEEKGREEIVYFEEFGPSEKHQKVGRNPIKKMQSHFFPPASPPACTPAWNKCQGKLVAYWERRGTGRKLISSKTQEFKSRNTRQLPERKVGSVLDSTYGFVEIKKALESLFWR